VPVPSRLLSRSALGVKQWLGLAAVVLVLAHLSFSRDQFSLTMRFLLAIPGLLFFWELHRYLREDVKRELPFNVLGLLYFYIPFSFPAFFNLDFFDIAGPVTFTEQARSSASIAIAVGSLCLFGGIRAGEVIGRGLRPGAIRLVPPATLPAAFPRAVLWYVGLNILVAMIYVSAPGLVPAVLATPLTVIVCFEIAMGLVLPRPELFNGKWSRYTAVGLMMIGWSAGLIRGVLEPVFRLGSPFFAGLWAFNRKVSFGLLVCGIGIYLLFQPVKSDFRTQVWGRAQTSYGERVEAWGFAFNNFFSRDDTQDKVQDSAVGRVSELDPVMHAFDMLPGQVQSLNGSGWVQILTAPIPRLIWRDKPTTRENAEQRYAIVFHRQTEEGARSTAILLPLLVDGYWNFGWPGIVFACSMVGLWVGVCQKLWSAHHWAIEAMGVAQFSRLIVHGHLGAIYSGLYQYLTGLLIACWGVYWLAGLLSRTPVVSTQRLRQPVRMGGRAPGFSGRSSSGR
jgi:hypothetical protein